MTTRSPSEPRPRAPRFRGVMLPWWAARGLAALLAIGAAGLPWLATRQGVLAYPEDTEKTATLVTVQLRPELVELPGGTFLMGSPEGEADREKDETQHQAEVSPFAICRTEVTLGQWEAVMRTRPNDCEYGCDDNHPVQNVSWEDAIQYLNRLTDRENELRQADLKGALTRCYDEANWTWDKTCTGYRLPTEAEWEYSARAGTTTAYSFGDDAKDLCQFANGADQAAKRAHPGWTVNETCDDTFPDLAPVGSREDNPWFLYDMHGNVWEWVWDWYVPYPDKPGKDYTGPDNPDKSDVRSRVLRGGSFSDEPRGLRSSVRVGVTPTVRGGGIGFRCARGSHPST